ncbi:sensor domain-containing diguanylate cyclase [Nitrincola tibetensis]|uniref:sensor domain-containing diguanylate cyclase n=1 Tax=Nitrincola tibetensis TaxID=2219697 RepID=UPI00138FD968|nr:sensor domain-containing diguanylate cyclase [Nitrincola tibetensis]
MKLHIKPLSTLERQIFVITTSVALIAIVLISISVAAIFYKQGIENAESVLRNKNRFIATQIQGYVAPLRQALEYSSSTRSGLNHLHHGEPETQEQILQLFQVLQNTIPNINFIFAGYADGSLLINNYTPPNDFDSTIRPWYQAALKTYPRISDGLPYQEIKSKEWMVSFSKAFTDDQQEVLGVISIDASMDAIMKALATQDTRYPTIYNFVLDQQGMILIHADTALPESVHQSIATQLSSSELSTDKLNYRDGDKQRLAHYHRIDELGWIVVTEVDIADIRDPIIRTIASSLVFVILASLMTTWLLSLGLSRYLITPLIKLHKRVQEITEGKDDTHYRFPNNEIGMISTAIEKLTEKALVQKNIELNEKNQLLNTLSHTDQLTSIANRRRMLEILNKEISRYYRDQQPFSVLMFDIDYFKRINDTFGHEAGDQVLIQLAQVVKNSIRESDTLGRWGGEEFLLICPGTRLKNAEQIAEKIFTAIHQHSFPKKLQITISLGLSEFTATHSPETLLVEIDQKMYRAKQAGRNRIQI